MVSPRRALHFIHADCLLAGAWWHCPLPSHGVQHNQESKAHQGHELSQHLLLALAPFWRHSTQNCAKGIQVAEQAIYSSMGEFQVRRLSRCLLSSITK